MAPLGMVGMLGYFSSAEVGIISLIVFLILSVTLLALCVRCRRNSGNAYDVNGITNDGAVDPYGAADTKTGGAGDSSTSWRNHQMPASTLERPTPSAN